jgi:hypothetical protein
MHGFIVIKNCPLHVIYGESDLFVWLKIYKIGILKRVMFNISYDDIINLNKTPR